MEKIVVPYLSSVFLGLIERQNKRDYLSIKKTKQYLNLPELIGDRIVKILNFKCDERVDHDEFVAFMLNLLMGTIEQRMYIAFRIYDIDNDEIITPEKARLVLYNIPLVSEERYGISHSINNDGEFNSNYLTTSQYMASK